MPLFHKTVSSLMIPSCIILPMVLLETQKSKSSSKIQLEKMNSLRGLSLLPREHKFTSSLWQSKQVIGSSLVKEASSFQVVKSRELPLPEHSSSRHQSCVSMRQHLPLIPKQKDRSKKLSMKFLKDQPPLSLHTDCPL